MAKPASKYPARAVKIAGAEESAVTGTLAVGEESLKFQGGDLDMDLGLKDLQLDIGGSKNSPVTFMHPDLPEWRFTAYEQRILKESVFRDSGRLRRQIREGRSRQEGVGRVVTMMIFMASFVVAALFLGFGIEQSLPRIVAEIPLEFDQELGKQLKEMVESKHPVTTDHKKTHEQLTGWLNRIVPEDARANHEYRLHLVDSPQPNSFSLPNGDIYIFTGVLHRAENSDEVAGLIAHEVAHILLRHGVEALVARKGPNMYVQHMLGNKSAIIAGVRANATQLIRRDLPMSLLEKADDLAMEMLVEANMSPFGLNNFMRRMSELEPHAKGEGLTLPLSLRAPTSSRVKSLAQKYYLMLDAEYKELPLLIKPPGGAAAGAEGTLDI